VSTQVWPPSVTPWASMTLTYATRLTANARMGNHVTTWRNGSIQPHRSAREELCACVNAPCSPLASRSA
jgi:hypothetical protein